MFVRIYPLVPAPLVFAGIGFALSGTTILRRAFARTAVLISGLFLIAGLAAVFGTAGVIIATVMSGVEAMWILAAAIAFARHDGGDDPPGRILGRGGRPRLPR